MMSNVPPVDPQDSETPREFFPLRLRQLLYALSIVSLIAAAFVAVSSADYGAAFSTAAGILSGAALITALANPTK